MLGSWFPATIIERRPNDEVVVEYDEAAPGCARIKDLSQGTQICVARSRLRPLTQSQEPDMALISAGTRLEASLHGGFWPVVAMGAAQSSGTLVVKTLKGERATVNIRMLRLAPDDNMQHSPQQPPAMQPAMQPAGQPTGQPVGQPAGPPAGWHQGQIAVPALPSHSPNQPVARDAVHAPPTAAPSLASHESPTRGAVDFRSDTHPLPTDGPLIYRCNFPGCNKEYTAPDSVRKHCKKVRHRASPRPRSPSLAYPPT